jgi:hypothetical protein
MKLFENHLEKRSANRKEEMNALEKSNWSEKNDKIILLNKNAD